MELLLCGLLFGLVIAGPLLCWLLGMFNPLGYMGVPPWRVPPEARDRRR